MLEVNAINKYFYYSKIRLKNQKLQLFLNLISNIQLFSYENNISKQFSNFLFYTNRIWHNTFKKIFQIQFLRKQNFKLNKKFNFIIILQTFCYEGQLFEKQLKLNVFEF